ncbi:UNKNOWN [Stylonychia lemnae]|uniref:Cyclin N-terminal domain-containing protein n=1 Tax=Stylonychia lemnae TaxID=5949 RepID=A0A078BEB2_STYLE|nr:UNKNOWN [Stylonychia lemnae]|eukprot:CDW91477.1 UNKNOWN [Stylonychia lemnae]
MLLNNTEQLNQKFYVDFANPTIRDFIIPLNVGNEATQKQQSGFNMETKLHLAIILEDYQYNKGDKIQIYLGNVGSQLNALGESTLVENKTQNMKIIPLGIQQAQLVTENIYNNKNIDEGDKILKSPQIQKLLMSRKSYEQHKKCQIKLQFKSQKIDSYIQTKTKERNTECMIEQQITNQDRRGKLYKQMKSDREERLIDQKVVQQNAQLRQQYHLLVQAFDFHEISLHYRQKMVNWMLQVLRVLKVVSPKTFMLSVQIMDKYFIQNYELSNKISKEDLHLIGMTSIIISSKFEDVSPIDIDDLVVRAGHLKIQNIYALHQ